MSFEYNGVVYRDLEPQVRYDAEQVQLLKQADVSINENLQNVNENLQTVNTEVSNKLTKPTNPSAESAVTMLADGTVGTKLLSEIGGSGGGKLYKHYITFSSNEENMQGEFSFTIINSIPNTMNLEQIYNYFNGKAFVCIANVPQGYGVTYAKFSSTSELIVMGDVSEYGGSSAYYLNYNYIVTFNSDAYTEL